MAQSENRTTDRAPAATREALLATSRTLFGQRGYEAVSLEEIVTAAGVTKGALYHYFPQGKRQLFEAVYIQIEAESVQAVAAVLPVLPTGGSDVLAAMKDAIARFLELSIDPELQRIALLDAPSVLGWERWREIAADHGLGVIEASLSAAVEAGQVGRRPVTPMAHMLLAALSESAILIARAPDPETTRLEVEEALFALLDGLTLRQG